MWWEYENLESGAPYDWSPAVRGDNEYDMIDFHLDLGCGKLKKARIGIDRFPAEGVDLLVNLETMTPSEEVEVPEEFTDAMDRTVETFNARIRDEGANVGLPFPTNSIESIVSHHCLEHIGEGFLPLMDECYRILKPGGVMRIIVPLFPSKAAVEDPDHKRNFMRDTFETFCGDSQGGHWHDSFSVPYTDCRFELVDKDYTAQLDDPTEWWGDDDVREIRVALRKYEQKGENAGQGQVQVPDAEGDSPRDDDAPDGIAGPEGARQLAGVA